MRLPYINRLPIRYKIFFGMMFLSLLCLSILATITFYQNIQIASKAQKYQIGLKEQNVSESISYLIGNDSINQNNVKDLIKKNIHELSNVYNTPISVYELNGHLIAESKNNLKKNISDTIFRDLHINKKRHIFSETLNEHNIQFYTYNFVYKNAKPYLITSITPNLDSSVTTNELKNLTKQYILIIILLTVASGLIAWIISKGIIKKIENLAYKMKTTNMLSSNKPISYKNKDELSPLVDSYNDMLKELQEQAKILTQVEREEAWREMARQVAHEINNPLTPLRLTVQNFENKFDKNDPEIEEKVKNFSKSIGHQIEVISTISKAFSDFAKMPIQNNDSIEIISTLKQSLDIYPEEIVKLSSNVKELYYNIDKIYLTRAITNIVKNGIQSINKKDKRIFVHLEKFEKYFMINITDNGSGIATTIQNKIFSPRFTTKTTGMGLGLSMVKKTVEDYNGEIWYETKENIGTTFYIKFYL